MLPAGAGKKRDSVCQCQRDRIIIRPLRPHSGRAASKRPSDQQTESAMKLPQTVADVLKNHVVFELECIDRMYLNLMVPRLQREQEVAAFFRFHRGHRFASSALMEPMSKDFVTRMEHYAKQHKVPVVPFGCAPYKGRKKDDIAQEFIARQGGQEGVMFLGKAQEKTPVCRTERRRSPDGQSTYPWIVKSTAMVNHYYWYIFDEDLGPFLLKLGTYFPYNAKVCLNGHERLKRQLTNAGIEYEPLDNGLLRCSDPRARQDPEDQNRHHDRRGSYHYFISAIELLHAVNRAWWPG